jgi:hypothetical protein
MDKKEFAAKRWAKAFLQVEDDFDREEAIDMFIEVSFGNRKVIIKEFLPNFGIFSIYPKDSECCFSMGQFDTEKEAKQFCKDIGWKIAN